MLLIFLTAMVIGFSGAMMPGSLLTYTIRQSLSVGPSAGFLITAGHAFLEIILIFLIFLGFDMVLQSSTAQVSIGIVGGLLLIYLGIDMITSARRDGLKVLVDYAPANAGNLFVSGMVISTSNPYFLLWWAVIGLGFMMQAHEAIGYTGVAVFYLGHITADFIWYGLVSTVVGTTRKFIAEKPYRLIIMFLGGTLIFFGGQFVCQALAKWF